jgi:hypothetical protein
MGGERQFRTLLLTTLAGTSIKPNLQKGIKDFGIRSSKNPDPSIVTMVPPSIGPLFGDKDNIALAS